MSAESDRQLAGLLRVVSYLNDIEVLRTAVRETADVLDPRPANVVSIREVRMRARYRTR